MGRKVIAIGTFGDDCHNVGLTIFKMRLEEQGYAVVNLGITVTLADVQTIAPFVDGVVLTSINGHGFDYLSSEASLEKLHDIRRMRPNLPIIVGGNLHPSKDRELMKEFLIAQGFSEVVTDTRIGLEKSMQAIDLRLHNAAPNSMPFSEKMQKLSNITKEMFENTKYAEMDVSDAFVPDALLENELKKAAKQWHETEGIGIADMLAAQSMLPKTCRFSLLLTQKMENEPVVQPRCGVATAQAQKFLFKMIPAS